MESAEEYIRNEVHRLYWLYDENCARTTLRILSSLFTIPLESQTLDAASGLHGGGGYRAQCGLVEGSLMSIGILAAIHGRSTAEAASACRSFAESFEREFGLLQCRVLRPGGFPADDPPHRCEELTCSAILFSYHFIAGVLAGSW